MASVTYKVVMYLLSLTLRSVHDFICRGVLAFRSHSLVIMTAGLLQISCKKPN